MKSTLAVALASVAITLAAFLHPLGGQAVCRVSLELVDASTGKPIPGVIRVRGAGENAGIVEPRPLDSRGWGLGRSDPIREWFVVPRPVSVELPAEKLTVEALAGLETERTIAELDLTGKTSHEVKIPIRRFSEVRKAGWRSANTHLHLRGMSREESDRYLRDIPAADCLDVLFISHLERAEEDRDYITNTYPVGRLPALEVSGVLVANGEEHRHNFGPQAEGYGHVMLLGIKELVQPVSIGYGISKKNPDAPSIAAGIDTAHKQDGTAIWCHNNWGYEDVPNWLAGRLDAQNIFDGGSHGSYAESFYHYLNAGLKVPFSTGTDWFMYDFARAYALVRGELTPESWLASLRAGRSFVTNGPLLDFRVNSALPGDTISLEKPGELTIEATAAGRLDFGRLELVQNGRVVESAPARFVDGHHSSKLTVKLSVSEPCWLAARVTSTARTEYNYPLFAHTSAVYVTVAGRSVRIAQDVRFLLGELETARGVISTKGTFDNDAQRDGILGPYDRAIADLRKRLDD